MGTIVTFYSYKGGVGQFMALANVAFLLAQHGHRVLAIDWDLEAPGLERYFEEFKTEIRGFGLLRMLDEASDKDGAFYKNWAWRIDLRLLETMELIP